MDHVVYVDAKENELEQLLSGAKTMIIRGAAGRKMPYGRVAAGDILYFINNNSEGKIRARGAVYSVFNSEKMTPGESIKLIEDNQDKLKLSDKQKERWAGKRYIILIEVGEVIETESFGIDRSNFGNMDDWLPVEDIARVR